MHQIQGDTRISPLLGERVTGVSGVVTGVRAFGARGFWLQDPVGDGDPATSEGIFVYTDEPPTVAVGDAVLVDGTVEEYYPGGADGGAQSVTQLTDPATTVVSSGNEPPAPVELTGADLPRRYAPRGDETAGGSIEGLRLEPERYALDFYESLEGMSVTIADAPVVGPSTEYGELWVTLRPQDHPTPRGGTRYASYAASNPGRLKVESLIPYAERPFPEANVGDRLDGRTTGPLDYDSFGGYTLAARELGVVGDGGLERERTRPQRGGELAIAAYNVENLHPGDPAEKFERLATAVVENLAAPDVLAVEEIQDDSGPTDDGTVSAEETLRLFTEAVVAAGGPRYAWRGVDPADGADGGQPGGNIRNVLLFNPERVSFVDRPGADADTPTEVVTRGGRATLSHSPGRIAPADEAWTDSRKPLVGEFRFRGETVLVVANHFASKGGDQPAHGRFQPPDRGSERQRLEQARAVREFVREVHEVDGARRPANVVVLGDLNDFEFSATVAELTADGLLENTLDSLPPWERYTYVFDGNAQVLDQTLVSPAIRRYELDVVHINAEFADQASDHDPQVLRFRP
ncbi:endonuclease/exonuclease/phosphatase family protein [Streptomyces sp. DSM 44915]|uniref:Endonuclease/exonuclease/phosphatase family protein n=1 Tax=Streptomyces chisholmiae TaxID=3075540 RepID=A0ABU2JJG9_9ACTN|nr:endonuclease/exonuclease/phosphatase family protein [Streptomyces sp. DSM 44915]MDT0265128.1 endonuclease/exonuclease/phosphatase family protein [Streptomyces sp. DSM 44915]